MRVPRISELDKSRPIHLSGVAGSAMSGLAAIFRQLGFEVTGTDPNAESVRPRLTGLGVAVFTEQDGCRIPPRAQVVIASAALQDTHPELTAARRRRIPVISYASAVGALMAERRGVAVAGTHGKTTVTSMIVSILTAAGRAPGFVVGGMIPSLGAGAAAGNGDIFVAEACEYNRSFLSLHPEIAVITNIEEDHLDIYGNLKNITSAFRQFCDNIRPEVGLLITSATCAESRGIASELGIQTQTFGIEVDADVAARDCRTGPGGTTFELVLGGNAACSVSVSAPGSHNVANALAAIAVCRRLQIPLSDCVETLAGFTGARRRFEQRGDVNGITVVDDYAHHPTELRCLLAAARERYPGRRIVLAFQPHQYSRTRALLDEFSKAVTCADLVLVPNIFFARDVQADVRDFDPATFEQRMGRHGASVRYLGSLEALLAHLLETLVPGDVVITAGAGDIERIIEPLVSGLSRAGTSLPGSARQGLG